MADVRVSCAGVHEGPLRLPPFELRAGEAICLHLPGAISDAAEQNVIRILTGRCARPGYRLLGKVYAAAPAQDDRNGFLRLLRPLRATAWLWRQGGVSRQKANAIVRGILDRDWPLPCLAGNPRTLLGLEAAWGRGAQAIIFWTTECDPSGAQAVYAAVAAKLAACSAIHLSRPLLQGGRTIRNHFPGATCLEVRATSAAPLRAESV